MGLVSPTQVSDGTSMDASDVNTPVNQLAAVLNGNVDSANLAPSAVATTNVADSAATPAKLLTGTGATWAWQTFTPTLTNVTTGNGTLSARYIQTGKHVRAHVSFILGSTSSVTGSVSVSYPVTPRSTYSSDARALVGHGVVLDSGTNVYPITLDDTPGTSSCTLRIQVASGTYTTLATVANGTPISFGTGDGFTLILDYEAA